MYWGNRKGKPETIPIDFIKAPVFYSTMMKVSACGGEAPSKKVCGLQGLGLYWRESFAESILCSLSMLKHMTTNIKEQNCIHYKSSMTGWILPKIFNTAQIVKDETGFICELVHLFEMSSPKFLLLLMFLIIICSEHSFQSRPLSERQPLVVN